MSQQDVGDLRIRIGMDGTEMQNTLRSIGRELNVLGAELREQATRTDGFGQSVDGLRSRSENLSRQIELQRQRIQGLTQRYDEAVRVGGRYSENAQNLQRQIVNVNTQVNRLEGQLADTNEQLRLQSSRWTAVGNALQGVRTSLADVGESFKKVGQTLSIAITAPIVAAGGAAFKLASDMNETTNKVDVAFKDSAKGVKDWGDTTLESFGIAKGTALDMAALYGDMGTAMGQSTGEASKMSTSLVGLAGDLASFKNIGIDQAQDALKGIFTGEGESLKSLGVIMQDSTLKAFALATGQKKAYDEMTQAEKVALRYAFVMDSTKNAQGDFARTSDGTANQMRIFQESLKQLGAEIGQNLVTALTPFIQKLNEMLKGFSAMSPEMQRFILIGGAIAAALGPLLVIIGSLITAVGTVAGAFATVSGAIAAAGGIMAVLSTTILPIIGVVAGLVAVGVLLYKNWDVVKAKGKELLAALKPVWETIKTTVNKAVKAVVDFVKPQLDKIMKFWDENGKQIIQILKILWKFISDIFNIQFKALIEVVKNAWNIISDVVKVAWELIKGYISIGIDSILGIIDVGLKVLKGDWSGAWESIKETANKIWNTIVDTIKSIDLFQVGKDIVNGLINGIKSMVGAVADSVKAIGSSVKDTLKSVLGIKSPSKVMFEIGGYTVDGLTEGIEAQRRNVVSTMRGISTDITLNTKGNNSPSSNSYDKSITIQVHGNVVGTNGMNELADIVSRKVSGRYGLGVGGAF